jgi:hypothetical protein
MHDSDRATLTQQVRAAVAAAPVALKQASGDELDAFEQLVDKLQSLVITERVRRHALAVFGTDTEEPDTVTSSGTLPVVDGPVTEVIPQVRDEHAPTSASE